MESTRLAINDPAIDTLAQELQLKSDTISQIIKQIYAKYLRLEECCNGAQLVTDEFLNNLIKTRENIEFNIDSYIKDLHTLQERIKENDRFVAGLFLQAALETKAKNDSFDNKDLIKGNTKNKE